MTQANEITKPILLQRLSKAVLAICRNPESTVVSEAALEDAFVRGNFSDFVGIVAKATAEERQRAVTICNRLGHRQTAQVIAKDSSDV